MNKENEMPAPFWIVTEGNRIMPAPTMEIPDGLKYPLTPQGDAAFQQAHKAYRAHLAECEAQAIPIEGPHKWEVGQRVENKKDFIIWGTPTGKVAYPAVEDENDPPAQDSPAPAAVPQPTQGEESALQILRKHWEVTDPQDLQLHITLNPHVGKIIDAMLDYARQFHPTPKEEGGQPAANQQEGAERLNWIKRFQNEWENKYRQSVPYDGKCWIDEKIVQPLAAENATLKAKVAELEQTVSDCRAFLKPLNDVWNPAPGGQTE